MDLWGPLSEESINKDFYTAIDFLGQKWLKNTKNEPNSELSPLVRYFESANKMINGRLDVNNTKIDKENAVRFFEFGYIVRKISDTEVIDVNGNKIKKSLSDLYLNHLQTSNTPNDYINELRTALLHQSEGHKIAFIDENSSDGKCPEFRIKNTATEVDIECKRPKPKDISRNSSITTVDKIASVVSGVSGKLDKTRPSLVYICIPPDIRLSSSQRQKLRHEIKGEIVERSPRINDIILQQIGLKEETGGPRVITGVKSPNGDTTILKMSHSLVPHYFDFPDDFSPLGYDMKTASNAHQALDTANEDLPNDIRGIREILDQPEFSIEAIWNSVEQFFALERQFIVSRSGNRMLGIGGTTDSKGYVEFTDFDVGIFKIILPKDIQKLEKCHLFINYSEEEFSVNIMQVYPEPDVGRIEKTQQGPSIKIS